MFQFEIAADLGAVIEKRNFQKFPKRNFGNLEQKIEDLVRKTELIEIKVLDNVLNNNNRKLGINEKKDQSIEARMTNKQ